MFEFFGEVMRASMNHHLWETFPPLLKQLKNERKVVTFGRLYAPLPKGWESARLATTQRIAVTYFLRFLTRKKYDERMRKDMDHFKSFMGMAAKNEDLFFWSISPLVMFIRFQYRPKIKAECIQTILGRNYVMGKVTQMEDYHCIYNKKCVTNINCERLFPINEGFPFISNEPTQYPFSIIPRPIEKLSCEETLDSPSIPSHVHHRLDCNCNNCELQRHAIDCNCGDCYLFKLTHKKPLHIELYEQ